MQDDCPVVDEVVDQHGVGDVAGECAVAPVGDRPDRAEHRGGAVSPAGPKFPVSAGVQELKRPARGGGGRRIVRVGELQVAYDGGP